MLFVDFIMANIDRHYRNFGLLRNSETLEWIGLAPVFDTERSMFLNKSMPKINYDAINIDAKPFKDNQAAQYNLLKNDVLKLLKFDDLKKVIPLFSTILKQNTYISEERRNALCDCLDARITEAITLVKDNRKIKINKTHRQRELDRLNTLSSIVLT